jgi:hypothetical protein
MCILLEMLPGPEMVLFQAVPAGPAHEVADQTLGVPGEGRDMTATLSRKGAQLDIEVWEEAQRRITEKEKKLRAKGEFRKVKISEVIADAFGIKA